MGRNIGLGEILDLTVLQRIQDSFAEATGLAAIIVDEQGNPILEYSNFTDYCLKVRETRACQDCFHSDAQGGFEAAESLKPQIYLCHAGLVDLAVPIFASGQYVGAILAGQVRLEPEVMKIFQNDPDASLGEWHHLMEDEDLNQLYQKTHSSTMKKIREAAKLMYTIANYLTEMAHVNKMQQDLHEKDLQIAEQTRLRIETESALKEADLKAIEAQINPHFLFNVLNTIGRLAFLEGAEKTQEMIYQFSDLMRYNLKRDSAVAETIRAMLDYIKTYLSIQKIRLGNRLNYTVEAEEACLENLIPVMTVQPLIENAINYVIEPRATGGRIDINIYSEGEHTVLTITDDGPGMKEDLIRALLDGAKHPDIKNTGIGINNVNKRLRYYYGPEYGLKIDSQLGQGTKITIRIPSRLISDSQQ